MWVLTVWRHWSLVLSVQALASRCPLLCLSSQELVGDDFQPEYRVGQRDRDELLPPHRAAVPGLLIDRLPVCRRGQERQRPRRPAFGRPQRGNPCPPAPKRVSAHRWCCWGEYVWYPPHPPPHLPLIPRNKVRGQGILESGCPSVCVSVGLSVKVWKGWVPIFKVKVSAGWNPNLKTLFLPYLLNLWTFCTQICYSGPSSRARVLLLLSSRSMSQWGFKSSANVCPDDIFWTSYSFLRKLGMLVYHHDLESHAKSFDFCLQGQSKNAGSNPQKRTSWSSDPFATKLAVMVVYYHEPQCCVTILDCYLQGQGYCEGSNPQEICVLMMSSELLNISSWNLVCWWNMTQSVVQKRLVLSSRSRTQYGLKSSKNNFVPYLLNFWTFCNQTWHSGASSWARVFCVLFLFFLLSPRSRSRYRLKSSGNIFWTSPATGSILPHQATNLVSFGQFALSFESLFCQFFWCLL